ncbi:hypothetical protein CBM2587_B10019 [Cupriavidus taiwanensis]|uniref:Uncharacterized protein n=1 Tax=Cupriavidus taiwanensis TaxID=164546 RepID=A0A375BX01_9BURK|nr:hypothetical protein CBM2587_B10019 [Cupriavidus taiwanensis]
MLSGAGCGDEADLLGMGGKKRERKGWRGNPRKPRAGRSQL